MSIYNEIYNILVQYVFGGLELTSTQALVTELYSLGLTMFMVSIPFIVIVAVICLITRPLWR